jgi:hypothetical protein
VRTAVVATQAGALHEAMLDAVTAAPHSGFILYSYTYYI